VRERKKEVTEEMVRARVEKIINSFKTF